MASVFTYNLLVHTFCLVFILCTTPSQWELVGPYRQKSLGVTNESISQSKLLEKGVIRMIYLMC